MLIRILEASLESAGKTKVDGEVEKTKIMLTADACRTVLRSVIYNDIVILGIIGLERADNTCNVIFLVVSGNYEQDL